MKNIVNFIVLMSTFLGLSMVGNASVKDDLKNSILQDIDRNSLGTVSDKTGEGSSTADKSLDAGTKTIDAILLFVKDSIFGVLGLISIGMFLYVGFKLVKAEGNPEEMKGAFMTLTYVVVGLFIVAISWAVIKIVAGLNF